VWLDTKCTKTWCGRWCRCQSCLCTGDKTTHFLLFYFFSHSASSLNNQVLIFTVLFVAIEHDWAIQLLIFSAFFLIVRMLDSFTLYKRPRDDAVSPLSSRWIISNFVSRVSAVLVFFTGKSIMFLNRRNEFKCERLITVTICTAGDCMLYLVLVM